MSATIPFKIKEILEAGLWVLENNAKIGRTLAEILGTVTNIRRVVNQSGSDVALWKTDGWKGQQTVSIKKGADTGMEMWIPWADNADQYKSHRMEIRVGGQTLAYIWQSGNQVRFNASNAWVKDGYGVPGESKPGGDRSLVIGKDDKGRLGFSITGFPK